MRTFGSFGGGGAVVVVEVGDEFVAFILVLILGPAVLDGPVPEDTGENTGGIPLLVFILTNVVVVDA